MTDIQIAEQQLLDYCNVLWGLWQADRGEECIRSLPTLAELLWEAGHTFESRVAELPWQLKSFDRGTGTAYCVLDGKYTRKDLPAQIKPSLDWIASNSRVLWFPPLQAHTIGGITTVRRHLFPGGVYSCVDVNLPFGLLSLFVEPLPGELP